MNVIRLARVSSLFVILFAAASAGASPSVAECLDASEQGQTLRNEGNLSKATARFAECASASCPAQVRASCRKWQAAVIESMPSIVVAPRNASDNDVTSASVHVDGAAVAASESGKAISLDPGPHVVSVSAPEYAPAEEKIIVRLGEKNRLVRIRLEPVAPAGPPAPAPIASETPKPTPKSTIPVLALGLGGVALAAIGTSLVLGFTARSDLSDLQSDPCATTRTCSEDETSSLRTRFIIADVALGVGVIAAGLALWSWLAAPKAAPR